MCLTTENARNLLIKSAVRRAESTGANCTPQEIAEMLTTQPSEAESLCDEEMSGMDDVPLRDLKVEQVKCRGEVTMADFLEDEESNDETGPDLTSIIQVVHQDHQQQEGTVNKVASNSKK